MFDILYFQYRKSLNFSSLDLDPHDTIAYNFLDIFVFVCLCKIKIKRKLVTLIYKVWWSVLGCIVNLTLKWFSSPWLKEDFF